MSASDSPDPMDYRAHPEHYKIGVGEQGVFRVQPYKSELLPHWRFKTPEEAAESAARIYTLYERYKAAGDFVGMDMARKYLQMGFTRSRRYANHKSGRKWSADRREVLPADPDPVKAESAAIFYKTLTMVRKDPDYIQMREAHKKRYIPAPDAD